MLSVKASWIYLYMVVSGITQLSSISLKNIIKGKPQHQTLTLKMVMNAWQVAK